MFYSQCESCSKSLAFVHVGPLRTGYVQTRDIGSLPFQDMSKQPFLARCFSTMEISLQQNLLQLHWNREYLIQVYYRRFYVPIVIGVRDPRTNGVKLVSPKNRLFHSSTLRFKQGSFQFHSNEQSDVPTKCSIKMVWIRLLECLTDLLESWETIDLVESLKTFSFDTKNSKVR